MASINVRAEALKELRVAIVYLEDGAPFSALSCAIRACSHLALLVQSRYINTLSQDGATKT